MKYNLITSANFSYFPFLDILINSARQHCKNLETIYVIDCGLGSSRAMVETYSGVKIIDTDLVDNFSGVHSDGWRNATRSKTLGLIKLYDQYDMSDPLILIDSDVVIVKDLQQAIDTKFDIQATVMSDGGHFRSDGIFIREIACFVCFNNHTVSKGFINQWSDTIKQFENLNVATPHETPAFNNTLRNYEQHRIGFLDENYVCADLKIFNHTLSIHLKSNGSTKNDAITNFLSRISAVNNYTSAKYELEQYLDKINFNKWLIDSMAIHKR